MAVFDISRHILGRQNKLKEITQWLSDNVGTYYGRGEHPVISIGAGWELRTHSIEYDDDNGHGYQINFHADITDEKSSVLFALVWA
jgi:hypothetical protein